MVKLGLLFFSTDSHYEGVITIINVLEIEKRKVSKGFRSHWSWTWNSSFFQFCLGLIYRGFWYRDITLIEGRLDFSGIDFALSIAIVYVFFDEPMNELRVVHWLKSLLRNLFFNGRRNYQTFLFFLSFYFTKPVEQISGRATNITKQLKYYTS